MNNDELVERKTFWDVGSLREALEEVQDADDYEDGDDLEIRCLHLGLLTILEVRKDKNGKRYVLFQ